MKSNGKSIVVKTKTKNQNRTLTMTLTNPENQEEEKSSSNPSFKQTSRRSVQWTEDTIDNEHMNKLKSNGNFPRIPKESLLHLPQEAQFLFFIFKHLHK